VIVCQRQRRSVRRKLRRFGIEADNGSSTIWNSAFGAGNGVMLSGVIDFIAYVRA